MPTGVYKRTKKHCENLRRGGLGHIVSEETRKKIRDSQIGKPRPHTRGKKNYSWKGGVTSIDQRDRTRVEYKNWRREVFLINKNECVKCGEKRNSQLVAHHKKPFKQFQHLRYEVTNGEIVCRSCHVNIHRKDLKK